MSNRPQPHLNDDVLRRILLNEPEAVTWDWDALQEHHRERLRRHYALKDKHMTNVVRQAWNKLKLMVTLEGRSIICI